MCSSDLGGAGEGVAGRFDGAERDAAEVAQDVEVFGEVLRRYAERPGIGGLAGDAVIEQDERFRAKGKEFHG